MSDIGERARPPRGRPVRPRSRRRRRRARGGPRRSTGSPACPIGLAVTRHDDVTAILRDRRFHSALSLMPQMAGVEGPIVERQQRSILSMEGEEHTRLRRLASPAFTPRATDRLRPFMRAGDRRARRPRGRRRAVRVRRGRLRALPDPDHLRAARRAEGGLEAVLRLGHQHLPHLQQRHRQRPARDQGAPWTSSTATSAP